MQTYFCVEFHGLLCVQEIKAVTNNEKKVLSTGHGYKLWTKCLTFSQSAVVHDLYL